MLRALYFSENSSLTQSELANKLMITSASVTFLVDGLENEGLVIRKPSKRDRRLKLVELTREGREVCEHVMPALANLVGTFFDGFAEDEKKTLYELLIRFWRNAARDIENTEELAAGF